MIDIDYDEGAFSPYVNGEKGNSGITFPVREDFVDSFVGGDAMVFLVWGFDFEPAEDSGCGVVVQDYVS